MDDDQSGRVLINEFDRTAAKLYYKDKDGAHYWAVVVGGGESGNVQLGQNSIQKWQSQFYFDRALNNRNNIIISSTLKTNDNNGEERMSFIYLGISKDGRVEMTNDTRNSTEFYVQHFIGSDDNKKVAFKVVKDLSYFRLCNS